MTKGRIRGLVASLAFAATLRPLAGARAQDVAIDTSAARQVLAAVGDPSLTMERALVVARLPGNQGLIRKAHSYGRAATEESLAAALVAAARHDATLDDKAGFGFGNVRDHAAQTRAALDRLDDPASGLIERVRRRIAAFTPPALKGRVIGYLVVGGTSGGFAFGEPNFYLNMDRYPSADLASTIMAHELFHAVQALADREHPATAAQKACVAAIHRGDDLANLFGSLLAEGTASDVGDVLALPTSGVDEVTARERARFARNVGMVGRSIVQLELSVHGLATDASVTAQEIYELGFYGDEVLYALGYVMARAVAHQDGDAAIGDLIGRPGAELVNRYVRLRDYGRNVATPALKPETIRLAEELGRCEASA